MAGLVLGGLLLVLLAGCEVKQREGDVIEGKKQFVAKCGSCHALSRAQTKGRTGPNLDEAFRQSLADGFERSTFRGVVEQQTLHPARSSVMYKLLQEGKIPGDERTVENIAAYVASVVAKPGSDTGPLAKAVETVKRIPLAKAQGGTLTLEAAPNGDLLFIPQAAEAPAGKLTIKSPNKAATPHNVALEGAPNAIGKVVTNGGVSQIDVNVKPGTYTFYCSVTGHGEGGMLGKLTVK